MISVRRLVFRVIVRFKHDIDYSRIPDITDVDIEESFVKGSGPGGQKINKTSSCVVLKHKPTGNSGMNHFERIFN